MLACPTPSRKRPTTKPAPEPSPFGSLIESGRLRWLYRLPLVVSWHARVSTVPGSKGRADCPARQQPTATTTRATKRNSPEPSVAEVL